MKAIRIWMTAAIVYAALGLWWKPAFVFGHAPGIYWLLVFFDWSAPLLAVGGMVAALVLLGRLAAALIRREDWKTPAIQGGTALLIAVIFLVVGFVAIVSPTIPRGHRRAGGRTVYLAEHPVLLDVNYSLFECDRLGLWCRQVYRSADFPPDTPAPTLEYDGAQFIILGPEGEPYGAYP